MIVEHAFITTMEQDEALSAAWSVLEALHFRRDDGPAGTLVARRGKRKPNARRVLHSPQTVRVEYDRGRVTVAASILEYRKVKSDHRWLMLEILDALQTRLAHDRTGSVRTAGVADVEAAIARSDRRRVRRLWLLIAALIGLVVLIFILMFPAIVVSSV